MQITRTFLAGLCLVTLGACGDTLGEQLVYGGGAGAAGAVITDGDVASGVVVGAAANAAYCQLNPGKCN